MTRREFETFALGLRPRLLAATGRIVGDAQDAEDVVQDAMLKLWSLHDELDALDSAEAFAMVVARRMAINALRKAAPGRYVGLEEAGGELPSVEEELLARERSSNVDAIMASLPDAQQTLLRLRHIEGYDNASIAALLGSTEGAVRTALSRARHRVAEIFASYR